MEMSYNDILVYLAWFGGALAVAAFAATAS